MVTPTPPMIWVAKSSRRVRRWIDATSSRAARGAVRSVAMTHPRAPVPPTAAPATRPAPAAPRSAQLRGSCCLSAPGSSTFREFARILVWTRRAAARRLSAGHHPLRAATTPPSGPPRTRRAARRPRGSASHRRSRPDRPAGAAGCSRVVPYRGDVPRTLDVAGSGPRRGRTTVTSSLRYLSPWIFTPWLIACSRAARAGDRCTPGRSHRCCSSRRPGRACRGNRRTGTRCATGRGRSR